MPSVLLVSSLSRFLVRLPLAVLLAQQPSPPPKAPVRPASPEDVIQEKLTAAGVLANVQFTKSSDIDEFLLLGGALRAWYEKQVSARESLGS